MSAGARLRTNQPLPVRLALLRSCPNATGVRAVKPSLVVSNASKRTETFGRCGGQSGRYVGRSGRYVGRSGRYGGRSGRYGGRRG
eukprot:1045474-Prorocentrum_minimum.AAC.1